MAHLFRFVSDEPSSATLLAVFVVAGLALFLLNAAVEGALTWLWTKAGRRMVCDLAEDVRRVPEPLRAISPASSRCGRHGSYRD
jgi:hypothetical protein